MVTLELVWKPIARAKYLRTTRWYFDNIGRTAAQKFMYGIAKDAERIGLQPGIGKPEPLLKNQPQGFRSLVSHRHTKIIYYSDKTHVYIVDLWDCRRSPEDLKDSTSGER